jgi:hypothetical protein
VSKHAPGPGARWHSRFVGAERAGSAEALAWVPQRQQQRDRLPAPIRPSTSQTEKSRVGGSVAPTAFILAVVLVAALNALFLALALWTATLPRGPLITRVKEAFASGALVSEDFLPLDNQRGVNQYNDCLILQMITNHDRQVWLNALGPLVYLDNPEWEDQCATLHRVVGDSQWRSRYPPYRYARYWHGYNPIAAVLLHHLSLAHVRQALKMAVYGALAVLLAAGAGHRGLFAVAAAIAVTGASVWAIPYFGQSLHDGPGDVLVVLGIGFFLFWRKRLSSLATFVPFCAAFGAVLAYVEMFTGVTAIGAGLLFPVSYLVAVSAEDHGASTRQGWVFATVGLAALALGSALTVAVKLVLSVMSLGKEAGAVFLGHLTYYMSPSLASSGRPSILAPFAALLRQGQVLTYGSELGVHLLYAGVTLAWLTAGCLALGRRSVRGLSDFLAFAVGASALPLWVLLFPTHTVIHSWLNVRLLILSVSLGLAALAWQLTAVHNGGRART